MDVPVSPSWSPLLLVLLLAGICALLYLAMQRQMKRMHANWDQADVAEDAPADDDPADDDATDHDRADHGSGALVTSPASASSADDPATASGASPSDGTDDARPDRR